ncbi:hypothetical protein [Motiliproteus sp. MSK22-1]|uniref:hypothetical protein n=1 Tax=Motiliproteus sp. MSK22-1 TaxID=1897630 RepID=UPI00097679CA|nr:hypothetical protein [Motiliproteus sp. MSK22-1]OMH38758.1 hypothetical protein BGP75_06105 [Motiliproteus sp. MSK22-1]
MKNSNSSRILLFILIGFFGAAAQADGVDANQSGGIALGKGEPGQAKRTLNLSLEQLSSEEQAAATGADALLTEKERQFMENLKPAEVESNPFVAKKKHEEGVSMSGSMLTEEAERDSKPSLQAGKDYLDSIHGAKVDLGVKF